MKIQILSILRNLLVMPPLILAGLSYGAIGGFLMGLGMAILLWDERLRLPFRWRVFQVPLRTLLSLIAVIGWTVAGIIVGALLPLYDRGTFVGIMRYGLPVNLRRPRPQAATRPASDDA